MKISVHCSYSYEGLGCGWSWYPYTSECLDRARSCILGAGLIDYKVFYAVSAVNKRWSFVKFWSFLGGPHERTLHRNPVKRSFACQGGCYPWHGAPFNVPSDGHKNVVRDIVVEILRKPIGLIFVEKKSNFFRELTRNFRELTRNFREITRNFLE